MHLFHWTYFLSQSVPVINIVAVPLTSYCIRLLPVCQLSAQVNNLDRIKETQLEPLTLTVSILQEITVKSLCPRHPVYAPPHKSVCLSSLRLAICVCPPFLLPALSTTPVPPPSLPASTASPGRSLQPSASLLPVSSFWSFFSSYIGISFVYLFFGNSRSLNYIRIIVYNALVIIVKSTFNIFTLLKVTVVPYDIIPIYCIVNNYFYRISIFCYLFLVLSSLLNYYQFETKVILILLCLSLVFLFVNLTLRDYESLWCI